MHIKRLQEARQWLASPACERLVTVHEVLGRLVDTLLVTPLSKLINITLQQYMVPYGHYTVSHAVAYDTFFYDFHFDGANNLKKRTSS